VSADRHARVKAIFLEASALSADKRSAYLAHACGNDRDLRAEVERLLSHHAAPQADRPSKSDGTTQITETTADLETPHYSTGHLIADRYRIVSLLGEGGMGRVYRAEDLRLNLTVALKFMPRLAGLDPLWRRRIEHEVKLSRAVSHSNVCRVFDLGEVDGIPFISMEFVEGEDLAVLLRRIGRITTDRAVPIARQICAGLAASHAQGVLHRDLKPSNIMLDAKGHARITDFGLAVVAGQIEPSEMPAGTPRYMAPELFLGAAASEQSDIYALGLVLYEMFTGRAAFTGKGPAEYSRLHRKEEPAVPSSISPDIDPNVESVILACLRKDPAERPASVLHVAAGLPGGDLLAAALDAGEIPTRELLAAAAARGTIDRRGMRRIAFASLVLLGVAIALGIGTHPITRSAGAKSPEVLREKARAIAVLAGLGGAPVDSDFRFLSKTEIEMFSDSEHGRSRSLLTNADDAPLFCYRETRTASLPREVDLLLFIMPGTEPFRFSPSPSGVTTIILDAAGRLVYFESDEPAESGGISTSAALDWNPFILASGRDPQALAPANSSAAPISGADKTAAYLSLPNEDAVAPARIEVAGTHNRLRYFGVFKESITSRTPSVMSSAARWKTVKTIRNLVFLVLLIAALPAAWQSRRRGGDVGGAIRVAGFIFTVRLVGSLVSIRHLSGGADAIDAVARTLASALAEAAIVLLFYLALERHVRRRWPRTLGSWSRLLTGAVRDPFVGRDVLMGCLLGYFWATLVFLDRTLPVWMGWEHRSQLRVDQSLNHLLGPRWAVAGTIESVRSGVYQGMVMLCVLTLATWLAGRRKWPALLIAWVISFLMYAPAATHPVTAWTIYALVGLPLGLFLLLNWGLVSLLAAVLVAELLGVFPMTADLSAWYAGYGLWGIATALGLGIWGFLQSRQSALRHPALTSSP